MGEKVEWERATPDEEAWCRVCELHVFLEFRPGVARCPRCAGQGRETHVLARSMNHDPAVSFRMVMGDGPDRSSIEKQAEEIERHREAASALRRSIEAGRLESIEAGADSAMRAIDVLEERVSSLEEESDRSKKGSPIDERPEPRRCDTCGGLMACCGFCG